MADLHPTLSSLERCRELLGDEAGGLSEEQIATIRDHSDTMAQLIVDLVIEQHSRLNEKDDDIRDIRLGVVRSQSGPK